MTELTQLTATSMIRLLRKGKISPEELVDAHLARIDRLNPELNAYVFVDAAGARDAARKAARKLAKGKGGSLAGLPLSIKSSISVKGLAWDCGSRLRAGTRATSDAPLVRRLRKAGAVILGVTNVPEFLVAWETDNSIYGRTLNPWDNERTPGGSSGGEAAAVAAGLAAGGVGSDSGGSIRIPAHFTGICGLKPTPGRIPAAGHFPVPAGPFASLGAIGPMARTVGDAGLLYKAMAGPDSSDPSTVPVSTESLKKKKVKRLTIGYFETDGQTPVTPEILTALRRARQALEDQGLRVREFTPGGLGEIRELWWNLFGRAIGTLMAPILREREIDLSPLLRQFSGYVDNSPPLTRDDLMETLLRRDAARARLLQEMQDFPVILCPVSAIPAFRHGEREWEVDGCRVRYLDAWSYSTWPNLTGNPAITVPVPGEGTLPVGVQIVGRPWEEASVLGVAALLEEAVGTSPLPPCR